MSDDFRLHGYTDELSVMPGESVRVFISANEPYRASVVRLDRSCGEALDIAPSNPLPARSQATYPGSYIRIAHDDALDCASGLTLELCLYATITQSPRRQGIVTKWSDRPACGWGLFLEGGAIVLRIADGAGSIVVLAAPAPVRAATWHRVVAGCSPRVGEAYLAVMALGVSGATGQPPAIADASMLAGIGRNGAPVLIGAGAESPDDAGRKRAEGLFNGKIDNPRLFSAGLTNARDVPAWESSAALTQALPGPLAAAWDFGQSIHSDAVIDVGGRELHGQAVNAPMRGVTGARWRAREQRFTSAPDEYSAIHFHEDDLADADWEESFSVALPPDLESGAYAVRVVSKHAEDRIPFFVTPRAATPRTRIAVLAPTFTYLAYGNEHLWQRQQTIGRDGPAWRVARAENPAAVDRYVATHDELGRSLYDLHADGSGVCYASRRRPLLNMRDDYRQWLTDAPRHLAADLLLLRWLARRDFSYAVLTDETLHREGAACLDGYDAVITGSHPEYCSEAMLDGLQGYLDAGGRLMYLGGNGFYWVTSVAPDRPFLIEVRRGNAGTRNWSSAPGECYHSTTGEYGGLWRHRGRPPQALVGVGFTALGYEGAAGYRRTAASYGEDVAFAFDGVEAEVFGKFGLSLGGAAGDEVDRADPALGTPPATVVLASSELRHDASYQLCVEDIPQTAPNRDGVHEPRVRADMSYLPLPNGAAVFSVGSINWIASLAHNGGDNDVARITENVLRHFLSENRAAAS